MGADGWMLLSRLEEGAECHAGLRLLNSDGSDAEMSGNGTRCAAAVLIDAGLAGDEVHILTGAGPKHLRLVERQGLHFQFEMNMGRPVWTPEDLQFLLPLDDVSCEVTILNVGNPQCVVFCTELPHAWERVGAEIEGHPHFPNRTNVSFVRVLDRHTIDVRFYERGAGVTMSSGTGSTGAMAASVLRGFTESPVEVRTPAGPLQLRWDGDIVLAGPAELIASGGYYLA